jgi:hypothetical protein
MILKRGKGLNYRLVQVACTAVLFSIGVLAQNPYGSLSGVITDSSAKPLAARITVTSRDTGKSRTAATSSRGNFVIPLLPPGTYSLEIDSDNHRRHTQDFELLVNQELHLSVALTPGSRTEEVSVSATAPVLKTESAAISAVIDNHQVRGLPLDGRNFFELSLLAPGVAPAMQGSAGSVRGDVALNINGSREDANNYVLDGVYSGDPKLNTFGVTPPVDAVREFEVLTSSYDASFGRNGGGQVNVVLKTGANQIHGTLYEFFRNAATDAKNYFAPGNEPKPKYNRNQFGGSVGGPIVKDRTFFFVDYEGRVTREGVTRVTNVPTAKERAGDFSESGTLIFDPFFQAPFPGNRIPTERIHPTGSAIANLYPLPNRSAPRQNFVSSPVLRDLNNQFDVRIDHALSSRDDLTGRYSFGDRDLYDPFSGPSWSLVPGFGTSVPRRAQNAMISHNHVFSPVLLNELRVAFNRISAGSFQENAGNSLNRLVGLPEVSTRPGDAGLSFITLPGYSPLGDEYNNPQHSATNTYQIIDQLSWAQGRHHAKFGFEFRRLQQNAYRHVQSRGFLNFLGQTGNSLAELLQGLPSITGRAILDNPQYLRTSSYNFFAQDTFRARSNLTLNFGLRYEYNSPAVDRYDRATLYDQSTHTLVPVGQGSMPRAGYLPDKNNFAPRVGLAWTVGNTVIRAGYGIYYDQSALAPSEGLYFNQPYYDFRLFFSFPPQVILTLSDPFPAQFPFPTPASALAFQRDLKTAYIQHWNFGLQREIGTGRVLEVAYVGSKGTRLISARDINQPAASPAPVNPRPVPQFGDINLLESRSKSNYHSLQARLQQRLRNGVSLLAAYTWSKSIDDASNFFPSAGDPSFPQDSYNTAAERARSGFDLPHRLSVAYSYDLPIARGNPWWGGWQTFGILTFQTGRPFTVALQSEFDNSNTGRSILGFGANDRPNVLRDPKLDDPKPERWFDTSAFAVPPFGSFGNSGRNILEGPGLATVNMSLLKDTRLTERWTAQFRAEAFNLFNRANFDLPGLFVGTPNFGAISSAQPPRRIQFGLKFLF